MQADRLKDIPKAYYRMSEFKHATGLGLDTIKRLIKSGELRSIKIRGSRLIPATELKNLENLAA